MECAPASCSDPRKAPPCPTPYCQEQRASNTGPHARVQALVWEAHVPGTTHRCECCGGLWNGQQWIHCCSSCGTHVAPGQLRGCFVRHLCMTCDEKIVDAERAANHICSSCNNVQSYCYC